MKEVLIAGGGGLIGKRLGELLLIAGYKVSILSRIIGNSQPNEINEYAWNPDKGILPDEAILKADYIINLAGATIGKRWTESYKRELLESRVNGTRLIVEKLNSLPHYVMSLLNISAIGYYGNNSNQVKNENSPPNYEYISKICQEWESAAARLNQEKKALFILRTASVISSRGGALPAIAGPVKVFAGSGLGSGSQSLSWVHIDDLCNAFIWCIENRDKAGIYNIACPQVVTNIEFTKAVAAYFHRPILLPNVPSWILKLLFGGFGDTLTGSLSVTSSKIQSAGFIFHHPDIKGAIEDVYRRGI